MVIDEVELAVAAAVVVIVNDVTFLCRYLKLFLLSFSATIVLIFILSLIA